MPIATVAATKSSLDQSALIAEQRVIGATIGAAVASICLLAIHSKYALELILVLLGAIGASIRGVNYTLYAAAIAGCVLIASGVSHHPSTLGAEPEPGALHVPRYRPRRDRDAARRSTPETHNAKATPQPA